MTIVTDNVLHPFSKGYTTPFKHSRNLPDLRRIHNWFKLRIPPHLSQSTIGSTEQKIEMMQSDDDGLSTPIQPVDSSLDEKIERPSRETGVDASDVLCGRGKTSFNHGEFTCRSTQFPKRKMCARSDSSLYVSFPVGNKRFRDAVTSALNDYMKADNRFEKSLVVHSIVDIIHAAGGRFLKRDFQLGKWYELSDNQAKEKVGHAIRDAVSSYESKAKKSEQKAEGKGRPRSERKDSGDSSGSGGAASRPVDESLGAVSESLAPRVISASGPAVPSHAIADTVVSARSIDDDGHDHQEQQFLAEIDAVLGPLPPDARDPMEPYLKRE
jgi:hypothetical protein